MGHYFLDVQYICQGWKQLDEGAGRSREGETVPDSGAYGALGAQARETAR